jgi:hypothetical protein
MRDADEWKHSPWPESPEPLASPEDASWAAPEPDLERDWREGPTWPE